MNTAIKRKNDNSPQRPLRSRDFVLLVAGQGISLFGNMMLRFAMSMWVLDETGSATIFASIMAVSIVPTILLSPFGGVLADRVNRRKKESRCTWPPAVSSPHPYPPGEAGWKVLLPRQWPADNQCSGRYSRS